MRVGAAAPVGRSRNPPSLSSAELCNVWKLREVRMRSSFGRGEERDVDRTDSSGEGGTVASEKRTVIGVADERTVCEESSIGLRGSGGGEEHAASRTVKLPATSSSCDGQTRGAGHRAPSSLATSVAARAIESHRIRYFIDDRASCF